MKKTEFLHLVAAGANVTADANVFTLAELRQLARTAATSGATVTIAHAGIFTASELHMLASEGNTHVTFPDLKVD